MIQGFLHRLVSKPAVYDWVQALAGATQVRRRLTPFLAGARENVLDIGGGTGGAYEFVPSSARYIVVDIDPEKIDGLKRKGSPGSAVVGDATSLCFADASVHTALCVAVSHHLDDRQLRAMFAEAARVVQERFIFVDALRTERIASRALWHYDRGSHPRTAAVLEAEMSRLFVLEHVEIFTIYHSYVLIVGMVRRP